jgi:RHS repeat-associated protein
LSSGCSPQLVSPNGYQQVNTADTCFQDMVKAEAWKGRAYKREVQNSSGQALQRTLHTFQRVELPFYQSAVTNQYKVAGLWRAFSYESAVEEILLEGGSDASARKVETFYNVDCTTTSALDAYGNVRCVKEYDRGSLVRVTKHSYGSRFAGTSTLYDATDDAYMVDRNIGTSIQDSSNRFIAYSLRFYDGNNTSVGTMGARGVLTRSFDAYNVPLQTSITGVALWGRDQGYAYDNYGNTTQTITYSASGTATWSGSAWTVGSIGGGGASRTTTVTYDGTFRAFSVSVTNPLNHIERADYDYRMGTMVKVVGPNGGTTGQSFNCVSATGATATIVIPADVTCAAYDIHGRMVKLVRTGDTSTAATLAAEYKDTERPFRYRVDQRESASAGTRATQLFYDGLGRQIQTKQESNGTTQTIVTDMRYNGLGQVVQQSTPRYVSETSTSFVAYTAVPTSGVSWTSTSYDLLGRPDQVTAPDATVTDHRYGIETTSKLRLHDIIDGKRHRTQYRYDAFGRLRNVVELSGNCATGYWAEYACGGSYTTNWGVYATTTYAYSPLDLLTSVDDAKGNDTLISYDSLGRKTGMTDPDMGSWSYGYDVNGNLTRQTDAKGQRICFYYDVLDRPLGRHHRTDNSCPAYSTNPVLAAKHTYDQNTNGLGQRTRMETNDGTSTDWSYDGRSRIITTTHQIAGITGTRQFIRRYDSADRVTSIVYPSVNGSAETVTYGYDQAWRQSSVCISGGGCYAQSATYDAQNQPTFIRYGNNLRQGWSYTSPMFRLGRTQVGTDASLGSIFDRSYGYDNVGNVSSITDNRTTPIPAQSYAYDHRDRLTGWTLGTTTQSYAYDTIGNLTTKAGGTLTYGANGNGTGAGPHQARNVGGLTYSYDLNGNLTSGSGRSYAWTYENMPASVTSSGVTESYSYNADGARVKKVRSGVSTIYLEGLLEQTSSGTTKKYYTLNGQTVAVNTVTATTSTLSYLHGDHLGSISVSTSSTQVATAQEFDPWGKVRSGGISQTSRNYTGQILDDTGLLFYNARYYDPAIGRFLSADTIVPGNASGNMDGIAVKTLTVDFHENAFLNKVNGESKLAFWFQLDKEERKQAGRPWGPANTQALNRYSYVQNNPLKYTDPSGHLGKTVGAQSDTWHLTSQEARWLWNFVQALDMAVLGTVMAGAKTASEGMKMLLVWLMKISPMGQILADLFTVYLWGVAAATVSELILAVLGAATIIGLMLMVADAYYGGRGIDITVFRQASLMPIVSAPTTERQTGYWIHNRKVCDDVFCRDKLP